MTQSNLHKQGDVNAISQDYSGLIFIAGLYIGLIVGFIIVISSIKKHRRKLQNSYRDMNDNDKHKTLDILDNLAEDFLNLYNISHVNNYKNDYNSVTEIITMIQQLNTKT